MANCYEALEGFQHYHNAQRVHFGRACNGKTPDEAFPSLPTLPRLPEMVQPNAWLDAQHGRIFRRRIRSNGTIQVDKQVYYVDKKLAKRPVLVHLDAVHRCLRVSVDGVALSKPLPIQDLEADHLSTQAYLKRLQQEAISIARYREMRWMQSGDAA